MPSPFRALRSPWSPITAKSRLKHRAQYRGSVPRICKPSEKRIVSRGEAAHRVTSSREQLGNWLLFLDSPLQAMRGGVGAPGSVVGAFGPYKICRSGWTPPTRAISRYAGVLRITHRSCIRVSLPSPGVAFEGGGLRLLGWSAFGRRALSACRSSLGAVPVCPGPRILARNKKAGRLQISRA